MFKAFIVDDDKYAADAIYLSFPWEELHISKTETIYSPIGLVERIMTEQPHIIFIDIEIGKASGLDIMKRCKELGSTSLFVIVSGHDNFSYARTAVNLGAIYYILKPIDPLDVEQITQKLSTLLVESDTVSDTKADGKTLWDNILGYIETHYAEKLQVPDICSALYISQTTFYNAFKDHSELSFVEYLTNFRLEKAKHLLINTNMTLHDISFSVGIQDQYYFNKIFKKIVGIPASEYRIQNRSEAE